MSIQKTMIKLTKCNTCTIELIEIAYRRAPWFKIIREPLVMSLKFIAFLKGYNIKDIQPPSIECAQCPRFIKNILKGSSPLFNSIHNVLNPLFDRIIMKIVLEDEIIEAKKRAIKLTHKETRKQ